MQNKAKNLRDMFAAKDIVRVIGVYDGLSAKLGEKHGFHALWASGLAISASYGLPDASILTMTEFLTTANVINKASTLPVIADCDTGFGGVNNVIHMVREYEQAGIAAVCIEDKEFPKRNSFLEGHLLADAHEFAAKIQAAKKAQTTPDFMVLARLESLIAGKGLQDALYRANIYARAGADAILVHSKASTPAEVLEFAAAWHAQGQTRPLVVVPTTYYTVTSSELAASGIQMVIYANQALRASVQSTDQVLASIQVMGTTAPIEKEIVPVADIFALTETEQIEREENWFSKIVARTKSQSNSHEQNGVNR